MTDLFTESLALQRIDLFARLVAQVIGSNGCSDEDKEIAIMWFAEMTGNLTKQIEAFEREKSVKNDRDLPN